MLVVMDSSDRLHDDPKIYDLVYGTIKDYCADAKKIATYIQAFHPGARILLDVACGTGEHARYLKTTHAVHGLDISERYLAVAREKNPQGAYYCADMRAFQLPHHYDVVMCLYGSICYAMTREDLERTIVCFSAHLAPGGILLIEPWLTREKWRAGFSRMDLVDRTEIKICRMAVCEPAQDGTAPFYFHYLVGSDEGVRYISEFHRVGLFSLGEIEASMRKCGLVFENDPLRMFPERGMYVARRA
jgi:SAM-dependent methyltransferase